MSVQAAAVEVLIVGGGPAGAAAAIASATAGLSTLVLERAPTVRTKVGEALHPGVESLLTELGAADCLLQATGARFSGVRVGWTEPPVLQSFGGDADGPWLGFQVDRARFETLLLDRAVELGARVRRGVHARGVLREGEAVSGVLAGPSERYAARVTIDASGPARWLSRRLGLTSTRRSPPLTVRYGYASGDLGPEGETPLLLADASGWSWTAKVAQGLHQWARLDLPDVAPPVVPDLPGFIPVGHLRGADATWRIAERSAGPGWFLTGEAAASMDPTSSKGVLKALTSGLFAGRTAAAMLRGGAPAEAGRAAYDQWLRRGFEAEVAALAPFYARLGARGFGDAAREPARRASPAPDQ